MAIKRYIANADNTITDAFQSDLSTRGTGSNMGAADVLESFYIFGQVSKGIGASLSSAEKSRILVQFDTGQINTDRLNQLIPASGSVSWHLNLYNAPHAFQTPKDFSMVVQAVSSSWQEGRGLDMESYQDQTYEGTGSNWIRRGATDDGYTTWTSEGGDFLDNELILTSSGYQNYSASFVDGTENLSIDVSDLVEKWLNNDTTNYGFGIKLKNINETGSYSYYTKKFFSRSSEYFFLRPNLEARWDDSKKDSAGTFFASSSLASGQDNLNTLYLYNYVRGKLQNIPESENHSNPYILYLSAYSSSTGNIYDKLPLPVGGDVVENADLNVTGGILIGPEGAVAGIYTASFAMSHSLESIYPVWHYEDLVTYHTGAEITVNSIDAFNYNPTEKYLTTIDNLKPSYSKDENARFRLFIRERNWNPNNYTVMQTELKPKIIEDAYYSLYRVSDGYEVMPFGTGSLTPESVGSTSTYSRLSYDMSGNYFDLSMNLLQPGYQYGVRFAYYINGSYKEQEEVFKFKVEE